MGFWGFFLKTEVFKKPISTALIHFPQDYVPVSVADVDLARLTQYIGQLLKHRQAYLRTIPSKSLVVSKLTPGYKLTIRLTIAYKSYQKTAFPETPSVRITSLSKSGPEKSITRESRRRRSHRPVWHAEIDKQLAGIGADYHRAMVATAPGEKLLTERRPMRNWTQLQFFPRFAVNWTLTFVLRKINKNCCHHAELQFLALIRTTSFVSWSFASDSTRRAYSAMWGTHRCNRPMALA